MPIQSFVKESKTASGEYKSGGGFTLIEVLVAALLVTLGAGGAFALIQRVVAFTSNVPLQLEASYLAQEGVEIVRNIRDTNFLKIHKGLVAEWTDGLINPNGDDTGDDTNECATGCGVGYQQPRLWASQADQFLNIRTDNGFYGYAVGTPSPYKRKIIVTQPESDKDKLTVLVEVTWSERNRSHKVEAASELYNWLTPTIP